MRQTRLRQLLQLTEEIVQSAREKDWDAMIEKEQQRRSLLREFFQHSIALNEVSHIEETIRQVMALDRKIISLAEAGKLEILKKMRNLSAGRHAIDAYVDNSG